jgi:hypothetical protein
LGKTKRTTKAKTTEQKQSDELQMDYFRAGGASTETEEQERRRKRDEALAWAKKRREQRKQKEAAAAAAAEDAEGGAAPQGQGWGMDTLNPWGSKRKGPLPTKASLRSNEPQPKLFGFIPTSAPRTAPSHHICHPSIKIGHH